MYKLELPDDVLAIIKDFSRPITDPRWRRLHRMTNEQFYKHLLPYVMLRYRKDDDVIHLVCIRNLFIKILVEKREMRILKIEGPEN
jgi:hypothetical protein